MKAYTSSKANPVETLAIHFGYLIRRLRIGHPSLRLLVLLGLWLGASGSAMAMCNGDPNLIPRSLFDNSCIHPPCGRDGEAACTVFVRVPSCDSTLAESGGRCVQCGGAGEIACPVTVQVPSCDATLAESGGRCVLCGGMGEIACPITVQTPSCDANLVESNGICVRPPCGRVGEPACSVGVRIPSCDATLAESGGFCVQCGGLGEIACPVTVQVPSCDATLAESGGRCVQCGGMGEIACPISVQVPSCDANLVESNGVCVSLQCGGDGQLACPVSVRIPSCDATLAESGGRCVQCGGLGEIACPVTVQVPSCDATLAESAGRCVQCGGLGEIACPVTVQVPSCDATLAESGGRCVQCGGLGEVACPLTVQSPSCDAQLMESNGKCIPVAYSYRGGEVVANPEIVIVYWGTQPAGLKTRLNRFYSQLAASKYFDMLGEYNTPQQVFGAPKIVGNFQINLGRRAKAVDTVTISREIDRQILAGRLPRPNANTIYMVHFGRNVPPAMGSNILGQVIGAETGQGFCAYHFTARTQVPAAPPLLEIYGTKIRIAVIPEASSITNCGKGSVLNTATFSATHELVETMTDPDSVIVGMYPVAGESIHCNGIVLPPVSGLISDSKWAWTSDRSVMCNPDEVADQCGSTSFKPSVTARDLYTVSQVWRNSAKACVNP